MHEIIYAFTISVLFLLIRIITNTDLSNTLVQEVYALSSCLNLRFLYLGGTNVTDAEKLMAKSSLAMVQVRGKEKYVCVCLFKTSRMVRFSA